MGEWKKATMPKKSSPFSFFVESPVTSDLTRSAHSRYRMTAGRSFQRSLRVIRGFGTAGPRTVKVISTLRIEGTTLPEEFNPPLDFGQLRERNVPTSL